MPTKTAHLIAQLTDKVSGPAAQMAQGLKKAAEQADALSRMSAKGGTGKLAADLRNLGASASQIDAVTAALKKYATQNMIPANRADWTKVQAAQMRTWEQSTVASLKHVIAAEREAAQAAREFASAQLSAAVKAGEASRKQRQAAVEQAKAHREAIRERRREAAATIASGAGVMAAHKGKKIGLDAISSAGSFDIATRKQREFTDLTSEVQANLLAQAKRVGQETQFSNEDVVKAQTVAMQGLPANFTPEMRSAVAEGILENVKNYATLMDTDLKEGAETIRSYLQQTGKDITTKQKAIAEANKATNQLVKMAKLGGMSGEDVGQFVKLAMSSGSTSGLTPETLMSLGALAKRGGLRGDEAGTFIKTSAGKLVSPTKKGQAAWNAAGVNHSRFVKMPDRLSTDALEGQFRLDVGKGFTPGIRKRLDAINADKTLIADQGRYIEAVTSAVEPILGKKKNGQVRASDRQVAAKAAGNYHKVAAQSVDVEGLLDALMKANPTLAQLNAIFTGAHGGKAAITQRQWDEFRASRESIAKAGDDPEFAARKAKEIMDGLGGSIENLKGSWENMVLTIGTANDGLIKFTADGLDNLIDTFSKADRTTQQAISLGAGAAALAGGAYGAFNLTKTLLGFGASSVALNGSAAALTASAAALDAAALKLAGGSVLPGASAAAGAAAPAASLTLGAGGAAVAAGAGAGAYLDWNFGGNPGAIGALTGQESDHQKTMRYLRERGAGDAAARSIGFGRPGGSAKMLPPGLGGDAKAGYASDYTISRGAVGDFLWGKERKSQSLPGFGSSAPKVDTSQIEAVKPKADEAKAALDGLNGTFTPTVAAGSITSALDSARALNAELAKVSGNAATAQAAVANLGGAVGRTGCVTQTFGNSPSAGEN